MKHGLRPWAPRLLTGAGAGQRECRAAAGGRVL